MSNATELATGQITTATLSPSSWSRPTRTPALVIIRCLLSRPC